MAIEYQNSSYSSNSWDNKKSQDKGNSSWGNQGGYSSNSWGGNQGSWGGQQSWGKDDYGNGLKEVDWSKKELSTFRKDFYTESAAVRDMSPKEVEEFKA